MSDKRKTDNLDNALLFSIGTITFIITLLQINFNDLLQTVEAIPFLILGILIPFIIGYMRGSIELDSIEERVRGWIYFIIGGLSYFAFFVNSRIKADYVVTESIFLLIIFSSIILAYVFIKWSNRVFNIKRPETYVAYSGTIFSAAISAFLLRALTSIFFDFQKINLIDLLTIQYSFALFWIIICLFSLSVIFLFEKAIIGINKGQLNIRFRENKIAKYIQILISGLRLLDFAFKYSIKYWLLFLTAFILWLIGCIFLPLALTGPAFIFFIGMLVFWGIAHVFLYKTEIKDLSDFSKDINFIWLFILIGICAILIALGGNIISLLEVIALLLIYYAFLNLIPSKNLKTKKVKQT